MRPGSDHPRKKASLDPRFTRGVLKRRTWISIRIAAQARKGGRRALRHLPCPVYAYHELLDILRAATQPIGLAMRTPYVRAHQRDGRADTVLNFAGIITGSSRWFRSWTWSGDHRCAVRASSSTGKAHRQRTDRPGPALQQHPQGQAVHRRELRRAHENRWNQSSSDT